MELGLFGRAALGRLWRGLEAEARQTGRRPHHIAGEQETESANLPGAVNASSLKLKSPNVPLLRVLQW